MDIKLYIHKMIYKYGGTESFTAKFLEILQELYPDDSITMITECFRKGDELDSEKLVERMNNGYGLAIKNKNFSVSYIYTKEPKLCKNKILRIFSRISRKYNAIAFEKKLYLETSDADLFVNCSNQAVIAAAKNNISIIHFPQNPKSETGINKKIPILRYFAKKWDKKYLNCYKYFMPNSQFTAYWLKKKWNISDERIKVFYHPAKFISLKKTKNPNQICICGRIEASKKIDVMVKAFNSSNFLKENCVLKIAGSCDNEDNSYINYIKSLSNANIQIIQNPSHSELEELYAESTLFWHAKGYGETNPMLMEHFGMTTVEAMSAGCVPVVINKGGQKEIVTKECGYTWDEPEQLVKYTEELMQKPEKIKAMSSNCLERCKMCSKDNFKTAIKNIIASL